MGQHYKDQNNRLHHLDDEALEYLLPDGCIKCSDEEATILAAKYQDAVNSAAAQGLPPPLKIEI